MAGLFEVRWDTSCELDQLGGSFVLADRHVLQPSQRAPVPMVEHAGRAISCIYFILPQISAN